MAPLPMHDNAVSTTAHAVVGGSKAALSGPTILAFMSILLAAMQGTLVTESADPCRISFRKLSILLGLEAAEVLVAIASEVLSFVNLSRALMLRLQWLQFVAPCALVIGLMGILLDVYYTIRSASNCRVRWTPFSASGQGSIQHLEMVYLVATTLCSIALVGWRQRWWWIASSVTADSARRASEGNTALSVGVMGFCVGFGIYFSLNSLITVLLGLRRQDLMSFWYVFHPNSFFEDPIVIQLLATRENTEPESSEQRSASQLELDDGFLTGPGNFFMIRESTDQLILQQRILEQLRHGIFQDDTDEEALKCQLRIAPLHVGNAIVGDDKDAIYKENEHAGILRSALTVMEHGSTLPLLASVLAAAAQMWDKMDEETFNAMKELADVVIVLALVEIAIALKSILWSVSGSSDNYADSPISDNSEWIQRVLSEKRRQERERELEGVVHRAILPFILLA